MLLLGTSNAFNLSIVDQTVKQEQFSRLQRIDTIAPATLILNYHEGATMMNSLVLNWQHKLVFIHFIDIRLLNSWQNATINIVMNS